MEASFDTQELMASPAELEKRLGEHTPSGPLAAVPSAQLAVDLAAILASMKSRCASKAAGVEDAALAGDRGDPAAPSRSTALILVPERELRALSVEKESAASAAGVEDAAALAGDRGDPAAPSRS